MKLSTLWNIIRGKPYCIHHQDGSVSEFENYRHYLQFVRGETGKPVLLSCPPDAKMPDLETLRQNVEDNPADFMARIHLGAHLATFGSPDEGYRELLEAIALLSSDQAGEAGVRRLGDRSFANYMAARTLDEMGRDSEARQHWQRCADDLRAAYKDEKYLRDNPLYLRAMEKLK